MCRKPRFDTSVIADKSANPAELDLSLPLDRQLIIANEFIACLIDHMTDEQRASALEHWELLTEQARPKSGQS
jgi:hypothetical protein